jgi:hypothetical protein
VNCGTPPRVTGSADAARRDPLGRLRSNARRRSQQASSGRHREQRRGEHDRGETRARRGDRGARDLNINRAQSFQVPRGGGDGSRPRRRRRRSKRSVAVSGRLSAHSMESRGGTRRGSTPPPWQTTSSVLSPLARLPTPWGRHGGVALRCSGKVRWSHSTDQPKTLDPAEHTCSAVSYATTWATNSVWSRTGGVPWA